MRTLRLLSLSHLSHESESAVALLRSIHSCTALSPPPCHYSFAAAAPRGLLFPLQSDTITIPLSNAAANMQSTHNSGRFASLLNHHPLASPSLSPSLNASTIFRPYSPPWFLSDSPSTPTVTPSHAPVLFRPTTSPDMVPPLPYGDIDSFLQHELSAPLPSPTSAGLAVVKREDGVAVDGVGERGARRGSECSNMSTSSSPNSALSLSRTSSPQMSNPSSASSASSIVSPHRSDSMVALLPSCSASTAVSSTSSEYGKLATPRRGRRSLDLDPAFHALPRTLRRKHGASCHMSVNTDTIPRSRFQRSNTSQSSLSIACCYVASGVRRLVPSVSCWCALPKRSKASASEDAERNTVTHKIHNRQSDCTRVDELLILPRVVLCSVSQVSSACCAATTWM